MFGVVELQSYKHLVESWVSTSMYKNDTESYAIRELSLIPMDFLHTDYKLLAKSFVDMFTLMALLNCCDPLAKIRAAILNLSILSSANSRIESLDS